MTEEAVVKYQLVVRFVIGPHVIHVQALQDQDKQSFPTTYKVSDMDMETIMVDWP